MSVFMDSNLTVPQWDFFQSSAKYTAAVAGFGSGKTEAALIRILSNMIACPGLHQAYLAPTYPLINDIFYPKVEEKFTEMGLVYHINRQRHIVTIQGLGNIYCRTMEKPGSIIGWEVGDAFLDEFDVLNIPKALEVFRKTSARLRQKNKTGRRNQIFVTTTPEGFKATYQLFKKKPLDNSALIQMSTYSNERNLPAGYIADLKDQYPSALIDAYLLGKFVNLVEGSVYYNYDRKIHGTHYVARPRETLHIGMDFNVYHMSAIVHVMRDGIPYAVDEFIGLRDTPDMIVAIQEKYSGHTIFIYPDASGDHKSSKNADLSDHALLESPEVGFIIRAHKANPLIKNRVQSLNKKLEKMEYFVNETMCPVYADSLEQQIYGSDGKPDKSSGVDHPVDAGGYFVEYNWPIIKPVVETLNVVFN